MDATTIKPGSSINFLVCLDGLLAFLGHHFSQEFILLYLIQIGIK
jgi:hypothetical protein